MGTLSRGAPAPAAESIDLAEFVDRGFIPQRLVGRARRQADVYRESVVWLARLLDRPAALADLTRQCLWEVQHLVIGAGFSPSHAQGVKKRLSAIAKHAWRAGLLPTWAPTPNTQREADTAAFLADPPPAGTLASVYRDVLSPQRDASRFAGRNYSTRNRLNSYLAAVVQFDRSLNRYSTPADLTDDQLAAFRARLFERNAGESTYSLYVRNLRRLARLLEPERFADRRRTVAALPPPVRCVSFSRACTGGRSSWAPRRKPSKIIATRSASCTSAPATTCCFPS